MALQAESRREEINGSKSFSAQLHSDSFRRSRSSIGNINSRLSETERLSFSARNRRLSRSARQYPYQSYRRMQDHSIKSTIPLNMRHSSGTSCWSEASEVSSQVTSDHSLPMLDQLIAKSIMLNNCNIEARRLVGSSAGLMDKTISAHDRREHRRIIENFQRCREIWGTRSARGSEDAVGLSKIWDGLGFQLSAERTTADWD